MIRGGDLLFEVVSYYETKRRKMNGEYIEEIHYVPFCLFLPFIFYFMFGDINPLIRISLKSIFK